ncbi:MAG: hypothetical protein AB7V04_12690 [Desulfomonilaceae bacterium]
MKKLVPYKLAITPGYYDDHGNYVQARNDLPFDAPRNQWTAINAILCSRCEYDEVLERMYCSYCVKLGYAPLNYQRKYRSL